jgi:hypothetical protein
MNVRTLPFLLAAVLLATAPGARAEGHPGCELPSSEAVDPLADRAGLLSRYEQLPRACVEAVFRECTVAADRGMLDLASAAVCSFSYEALLRQKFGGNFNALLAWWQAEGRANSTR